MPLRSKPQTNKQTRLPAGVSCTWRQYPGGERSPYLEYQVVYKEGLQSRIKHFYVGVAPTRKHEKEVRDRAISFRRSYEDRTAKKKQ